MAMFTSHRQPPSSWTKLIDEWVLDMQARCLTDRTVESYWYRVTDFARSCEKPPRHVLPADVQSWLTRSNLDASTKAGRRASVNEFYKWAIRANRLKTNPVAALPPIKRPKKPAKQPAPESAVAAGVWAENPKARLMVRLDAEAGLRREEISKVKGSDVIESTHGGESIYYLLVHGKGGKTRIVPICNDLAQEIRGAAGDGWLFPGKVNGHCCVDHVYRVIKRTTGWPTHSFRRRYGRIAYEESGHDLRAVQELLGHESPVTTQSYIFVPSSDLTSIARRVRARRPQDVSN